MAGPSGNMWGKGEWESNLAYPTLSQRLRRAQVTKVMIRWCRRRMQGWRSENPKQAYAIARKPRLILPYAKGNVVDRGFAANCQLRIVGVVQSREVLTEPLVLRGSSKDDN